MRERSVSTSVSANELVKVIDRLSVIGPFNGSLPMQDGKKTQYSECKL